jgi:LysM repeat protein
MGLFGKSFEEKVKDAVDAVTRMNLGVRDLRAVVDGKVVTLEGQADSFEIKGRVIQEFNKLVNTENTLNKIRIPAPQAAPAAQPGTSAPSATAPVEQIHLVQAGDTLSALSQKYYGKASLYMKIFEANRDILNDPNLIKIGQKLRIPK